jgi:hypothetical protein
MMNDSGTAWPHSFCPTNVNNLVLYLVSKKRKQRYQSFKNSSDKNSVLLLVYVVGGVEKHYVRIRFDHFPVKFVLNYQHEAIERKRRLLKRLLFVVLIERESVLIVEQLRPLEYRHSIVVMKTPLHVFMLEKYNISFVLRL